MKSNKPKYFRYGFNIIKSHCPGDEVVELYDRFEQNEYCIHWPKLKQISKFNYYTRFSLIIVLLVIMCPVWSVLWSLNVIFGVPYNTLNNILSKVCKIIGW